MIIQDSPGQKPLRMSVDEFRARRQSGEATVVLDVRGPMDWGRSDATIPGALRAYPEIRIDPSWPRDRLVLTY